MTAALAVRPPLQAVPKADLEVWVEEAFPRLPDDEYSAICTGYEVAKVFKGLRVFIHFRVADGPHMGAKLFRAYPVRGHIIPGRGPGTGIRYKLHRRARLFETLVRVLELPANTKAHRVYPSELVNKLCRIKTRTVTEDSKQRKLPEGEVYSVVDDILCIEAG